MTEPPSQNDYQSPAPSVHAASPFPSRQSIKEDSVAKRSKTQLIQPLNFDDDAEDDMQHAETRLDAEDLLNKTKDEKSKSQSSTSAPAKLEIDEKFGIIHVKHAKTQRTTHSTRDTVGAA